MSIREETKADICALHEEISADFATLDKAPTESTSECVEMGKFLSDMMD